MHGGENQYLTGKDFEYLANQKYLFEHMKNAYGFTKNGKVPAARNIGLTFSTSENEYPLSLPTINYRNATNLNGFGWFKATKLYSFSEESAFKKGTIVAPNPLSRAPPLCIELHLSNQIPLREGDEPYVRGALAFGFGLVKGHVANQPSKSMYEVILEEAIKQEFVPGLSRFLGKIVADNSDNNSHLHQMKEINDLYKKVQRT